MATDKFWKPKKNAPEIMPHISLCLTTSELDISHKVIASEILYQHKYHISMPSYMEDERQSGNMTSDIIAELYM